jgi:hydroxyacylglutathione hydrolase
MISLRQFVLGPLENNTYLLTDQESREAVVIDPSFDSARLAKILLDEGLHLSQVWITHAHFDHTIGLFDFPLKNVRIALHAADIGLWKSGGRAENFSLPNRIYPEVSLDLSKMGTVSIGTTYVKVLHTPGHTPGHVAYYFMDEKMVFVGDLIFKNGIGRTDLPGGDYATLIRSIQEKIFTLPEDTRLLTGHGPETTVSNERSLNPFFS